MQWPSFTAERALRAAVLGVVCLFAVAFTGHLVLDITYPVQLEYGEGVTYAMADVVAQKLPLYTRLEDFPWTHVTYTPLYLMVTGWLMRTVSWTFMPGRMLAALSYGVDLLLLYYLMRGQHGRRAARVAVVLFACTALTASWPGTLRVDFPAMVFELLALLFMARNREGVAGCLSVCAFMTKPSVLAVVFGMSLFVLWQRRTRAVFFFGGMLATMAVFFSCMYGVYGAAFFTQVFSGNALGLDWPYAGLLLKCYVPAVVLVWIYACMVRTADRLWLCYLAGSLVTAALVVRATSFYNHFLELQLATSALAAIGIEQRFFATPRRAMLGWALILLQIAGPGAFVRMEPYLYSPMDYVRYELPDWIQGHTVRWYAAGFALQRELSEVLAAHPGPALAENTGTMLACGRRPLLVDPVPTLTLGELGQWDERQFLDMIANRYFAVITLQGNRLPQVVRDSIARYYQPIAKIADIEIVFIPRK